MSSLLINIKFRCPTRPAAATLTAGLLGLWLLALAAPQARAAPAAPATPTATWGDGSVTLTWTAPHNGGSRITDYDYQTRNQTDGGAWTEYEATDTSDATTKTLTLANGKHFRLRIRAGNVDGDSNWSWPPVDVVVGSPDPVAAPTLTIPAGGQVRVTWTAPANNGSAVTGYSLWHRQGAGAGATWTEVTGISAAATSHTLTLTTGRNYTIGVEAHNSRGGNNPSTTEFNGATTAIALAGLTAGAVKETAATLTIANHTGNWYYKQTAPAGGSCSSAVSGTTADLDGLTGGTAYTFTAYGDSGCATVIASETFSTVGLTAGSVGKTAATLNLANWTAAWWHKKTVPATPAGTCVSVAANTLTASLTSLAAGTAHTWEVYSAAGCDATNKIADVGFTTVSASATEPSAPATPAVAWGDGTATLTWTAPDNGGSPITDYDYDTRNQTDGAVWVEYDENDTSTATSKTLTLANGKLWRLRIRAGNAVGDSNWSYPFAEVVVGSPAPVAAPTLTTPSAGQVRVAWTAPANNGSAVTGYSLWHRQGTGAWTEVTGIAASATSHTLTLTVDQTYVIGVEAHNARGGSNPSASSFGGATSSATTAPTAPPAPTGLTGAVGNQQVTLTWTSGGDGAARRSRSGSTSRRPGLLPGQLRDHLDRRL